MDTQGAPLCLRHQPPARMRLVTLHSGGTDPDQVLALYECPDCGAERRVPILEAPTEDESESEVA
ncbi:MAG: hypothetical protein M3024_08815 [Candidatus Dormibacteraeota bacterium]|nr:hypothetical protein [Candidatus Dormibacteraeota bacterium]